MLKIYNLWRKIAPKGLHTNDEYLPYGVNDDFPLVWDETIQNSPSGTSCLSTLQDFLEGFGFSNTDLEKKIVNGKGETLFQIHQQTVKSFAEYEAFYWLIRYSATGEVTEWEVLPFESCRLGKPDSSGYIPKIHYNPFFGTLFYNRQDKKETIVYDVFNPSAARAQIQEQGDKFKGQVYYFGTTRATSPYYSHPEAHVAWWWMKIESAVAKFHQKNLDHGFLQRFMLLIYGDPNAPSTNPDYQDWNGGKPATVAEEFDDLVNQNFMGSENNANMWVNWVSNKEEKPEVIPMPNGANGDLFVTLDNQATKKITIAWKIPSILANIHEGVSLGGDGNTVRVAVKLMQQRVVKKQRILTDNYSKILRLMATPVTEDIVIVPYNPYPELEVIDDKIWNEMSRDERRKWIQDNTEIELLEEDLEQPSAPVPQVTNAIPIGFPEGVIREVKKALDYVDKMGLKCLSKGGKQVSEMILNNQSMGLRQMKRIHNYLKKNEQYSNGQYRDGCNVILYNAWGGKAMFNFLDNELKRVDSWLN